MSAAKFHILDGFPKSVSPSSHATESDGFVFLTGQFGRNLDDPAKPLPDGIRAQTDLTLLNMRRVLEFARPLDGPVMSVRVFLTHFKRDYDAMNEVYAGSSRRVRGRHGPASALPTWCAMRWSRLIALPSDPPHPDRHRRVCYFGGKSTEWRPRARA